MGLAGHLYSDLTSSHRFWIQNFEPSASKLLLKPWRKYFTASSNYMCSLFSCKWSCMLAYLPKANACLVRVKLVNWDLNWWIGVDVEVKAFTIHSSSSCPASHSTPVKRSQSWGIVYCPKLFFCKFFLQGSKFSPFVGIFFLSSRSKGTDRQPCPPFWMFR